MNTKIDKCPHCGGDQVGVEQHKEGRFFVQCYVHTCGASGGFCDTPEEAISVWSFNREQKHTVEEDFAHYLSYSGQSNVDKELKDKLFDAYKASWGDSAKEPELGDHPDIPGFEGTREALQNLSIKAHE